MEFKRWSYCPIFHVMRREKEQGLSSSIQFPNLLAGWNFFIFCLSFYSWSGMEICLLLAISREILTWFLKKKSLTIRSSWWFVAANLEQQVWKREFALWTSLDQFGKSLEVTEEVPRVKLGWIISILTICITYILTLWHGQKIFMYIKIKMCIINKNNIFIYKCHILGVQEISKP